MTTDNELKEMNGTLNSIKNDIGFFSANCDLTIGKPIKDVSEALSAILNSLDCLGGTMTNIDNSLDEIADSLERIAQGINPKYAWED